MVQLREIDSAQITAKIFAIMDGENNLKDIESRGAFDHKIMECRTKVERYAITSGVIVSIPLISAFDSFWLAEKDRAPRSGYFHSRPADGLHRIVIPDYIQNVLMTKGNRSTINIPEGVSHS